MASILNQLINWPQAARIGGQPFKVVHGAASVRVWGTRESAVRRMFTGLTCGHPGYPYGRNGATQ